MLPFLKLKRQPVAGLIIKNRTPHSYEAPEQESQEQYSPQLHEAVETCIYAFRTAVMSDDISAASKAFVDAVKIVYTEMEKQEHEDQAEDAEEKAEAALNTYKYQNIKAVAHGEEF